MDLEDAKTLVRMAGLNPIVSRFACYVEPMEYEDSEGLPVGYNPARVAQAVSREPDESQEAACARALLGALETANRMWGPR